MQKMISLHIGMITQLLIDRRDKDLDEDEIAELYHGSYRGKQLDRGWRRGSVKIHFHNK